MVRQVHDCLVAAALFAPAATAVAADAPPDFATEIIPMLTKSGCNAAACHGAASGRGGFKLSLFGSDSRADYASIVEEYKGRRVHLVRPETSLVLRKPS